MRPIFDKERREERRRARRREKTTVRDADVNDLLARLAYGDARKGGAGLSAGLYDPVEREVILYPGTGQNDPTVLEHELIHSEQISPLKSRLLKALNPGRDKTGSLPFFSPFGSVKAQDAQTRRSLRKIARSIGFENLEKLGGSTRELLRRLGSSDPKTSKSPPKGSPLKYILDPTEFEAISTSAVNSPAAKNVDFTQSFDQVKDALYALGEGPNPNVNIYHLRSAMDQLDEIGAGDREKDLFMKAVRSNLRS